MFSDIFSLNVVRNDFWTVDFICPVALLPVLLMLLSCCCQSR